MIGAGERYVQPFVILRSGSLLKLAAVAALPVLGAAIAQWLAANVTDSLRRRKLLFVACAGAQAMMWIPMCIAVFLPPPWGYVLLLPSFVIYFALGSFGVPPWSSVMGDLVPPATRGRYFGMRNLLVGLVMIASFFLGGAWLSWCETLPASLFWNVEPRKFGFLALFSTALVARLGSTWYLARMHEPPYDPHPSDRFSLLDFIRRAPHAHFGRFVLYCMLVYAGIHFVVPCFNWYLLDQLRIGPAAFAWIWSAQLLSLYGSSPLIGRLADRVGSKRVLALGGIGLTAVPLLLMASSNFYYLLAVQVCDGVAMAAFTIAALNYLFDIVTPGKRARCTAYSALFNALGMTLGTFGGAAVALLAPASGMLVGVHIGHPFMFVLLVAVAARLLPNLVLLRSFREWRLVAAASAR